MKTAAQAKADKQEAKEQVAAMVDESRGVVKRGRPKKALRTIAQVTRKIVREVPRKELDDKTLARFIELINENYPHVRFAKEGSNEQPFTHFIDKDERRTGWPKLITTSGNKFWITPGGELIVGQDNTSLYD